MFNKKLKEQLSETQQSSELWERKFHEIENELDTQRGLKRYYRQEFEQLAEKNNSSEYFRMKKSDWNEHIKYYAKLCNENKSLKEEIEQNKQSVENYTINLDVSSIDINELTRKVIENINKGRY